MEELQKNFKNIQKQHKEEKAENKGWKTKIKKLEKKIVSLVVDPKDPKLVQGILDENEKQIQLLKKMLKIHGTSHVQLDELIALQMEKDKKYQEMQKIKEHLVEYQKDN